MILIGFCIFYIILCGRLLVLAWNETTAEYLRFCLFEKKNKNMFVLLICDLLVIVVRFRSIFSIWMAAFDCPRKTIQVHLVMWRLVNINNIANELFLNSILNNKWK